MEEAIKIIGVVANFNKPAAAGVLEQLVQFWRGKGARLVCPDKPPAELAEAFSGEDLRQAQMVFALGGDGTVLRAVRLMGEHQVPVFGINLGGLGFLTAAGVERVQEALETLSRGQYEVSERMLLECTIHQAIGGQEFEYHALNDIALGWGETTRVVTLQVAVDGEEVTSYVCDGLIISTPTGSTGHSLSAGGPIVHPESDVILVNPICPHTLSNRPLILPARHVVDVRVVNTPKKLLFSADGQEHAGVSEGDWLKVCRSPRRARIIFLPDTHYFGLLREKLHWRGSSAE